ncbi:MAG: ornithine cyclodeaminase family protein [Peptostreptococcaceae bacterium]|nr:ornithine cyclodeaminase family protein [Peptostreptococcaceae bacterium]
MFKVRVLNQENIKKVLDMSSVIDAVERVYVLKHQKKADVFPMVFHEFERGVADMDIKSGYLKEADIFGLKLVSWFGENGKKNLPALIGTTLVFDGKTGVPVGLLSAEHVTGMRTGAAGAIGAKYLARKNSESLLMVGTGHQALFQIGAVLTALPGIRKVMVHSPRTKGKAEKFCEGVEENLRSMFPGISFQATFEAVNNLESAVGVSDIIITATPSRKPMILREWVKPGTHISCIGADMEGKQEIDESLYEIARVFVDDFNQAAAVGETATAVAKGIVNIENPLLEIGEVISGETEGRLSEDDITIFDSTGIALQDLMVSKLALDKAKLLGIGDIIDL